MTLQSKLDAIGKDFKTNQASAEVVATMHAHTAHLVASGQAHRAVGVGRTAPEFSLIGRSGSVSLSGLRSKGPVALTWFRGAWCPYCVAELDALQQIAGDIRSAGGTLVAISPQQPARNRALEKRLGLDFEILHDEGNLAANSYGLRYEFPDDLRAVYEGFGLDLPKQHGGGGWELPMPARYVIGTNADVTYAAVHADYTQRPEPQETLEALRAAR